MNEDLFFNYIHNFFGYGAWNSKFWFIGLEEGGGDNLELVVGKMNALPNVQDVQDDLVDIYQFQVSELDENSAETALCFLGPNPKLQTTWKPLIKIMLKSCNLPYDNESVKNYQSSMWGRVNQLDPTTHGLIEMMPLPSPSLGHWNYNEWTRHFRRPFENRKVYYNFIRQYRVEVLQNKLAIHQPKLVLFYGKHQDSLFNDIVGDIQWINHQVGAFYFQSAIIRNTLFIKSMHPVARGVSNVYWEAISDFILLNITF